MANFVERIKERYKINKKSSLFFISGLGIMIITCFLMNLMANIASFWSIDSQDFSPLPDLLHEYFLMDKELYNIIEYSMNFVIFTTLLSIFVPRNAIEIYFKVFVIISISYFMRMSLVSITNIPLPSAQCIKVVRDFLTHCGLNRCGDLMFSGHTLVTFCCILTWIDHPLLIDPFGKIINKFMKIVMLITGCTVITLIIINRNHYSIDVILSIYCTGAVWIIYGLLWENYLRKEKSFQPLVIEENE